MHINVSEIVNLAVTRTVLTLIRDLFDPLGSDLIIVGLPRLLTVSTNLASKLMPSSAKVAWKFLEDRDEVEDIVTNAKDIPHRYYEGDARKQSRARRCESDPREYGFWRRCLSDDRKLTLQDTFKPDSDTWLDGCSCEVEGASKNIEETFGKLDVIGDEEDNENDDDCW